MVEYLTEEQVRQRSGMEFFVGARLDRILELRDQAVSTARDEVWVSTFDKGWPAVEGGVILGMRVIASASVPVGEVRLWSFMRKGFVA